MGYLPVNYSEINIIASKNTPMTIKPCNNESYAYWERSLFQRALSVIRIDGVPEEWDENIYDFLFWCLFTFGYVACFKSDKFGRAFQPCTLNGYDFYYQYTDAVINNPKLQKTFKIGVDCEILKISPDYMGIWDIISRYARRLSEFDPAIDLAIINSKYSNVWGARNKSGAKFLEKVSDKINQGEPAVIFDTSILLPIDKVSKDEIVVDLSNKDVKNTYIGNQLLQDFTTVLKEFDSEIGIPSAPYEKAERMVTDEVNIKTNDSTSRSKIWVKTLNGCLKTVNPMLETNMKAVHNFDDNSNETSKAEGGVT